MSTEISIDILQQHLLSIIGRIKGVKSMNELIQLQEILSHDEFICNLEASSIDNNPIERLNERLQHEVERRVQLEEECDLLAAANNELIERLHALTTTDPVRSATNFNVESIFELKLPGYSTDRPFVNSILHKIENASAGSNLVSVGLCDFPITTNLKIKTLLVGGSNKCLTGYSSDTFENLFSYNFSAPVICMDTLENIIALGLMDGRVIVVSRISSCLMQLIGFHIFSNYSQCAIHAKWSFLVLSSEPCFLFTFLFIVTVYYLLNYLAGQGFWYTS